MAIVSVIIPSYNCARYVEEAIESVLNQTYNYLEIIVVDDGSTDNTREVLKEYIGNGQIKYVYQENQGPGAARNTGIKCAKGDYIAFLDSDDTLTENSIEKRMNLIIRSPEVGLVFSDYYYEKYEFSTEKTDIKKKINKSFTLISYSLWRNIFTLSISPESKYQSSFQL